MYSSFLKYFEETKKCASQVTFMVHSSLIKALMSSLPMVHTSNQVTFIDVSEHSGQRVDNFLKRHLPGVPLSHIHKILRKGEVRVNKKRIKAGYKLQFGDHIRIPPVNVENVPSKNPPSHAYKYDLAVLFEDENMLIINKPSGLAVHGGSGLSFGLIELARKKFGPKIELVHRLDKETSGCIMLAKNLTMLRALQALLHDKKITKTYHAVLQGYMPNTIKVNEPLKKFDAEHACRMVKVHPLGRPSITEFTTLARNNVYSLVAAKPITGRTHQIRVHAAHIRHPILGDERYGLEQSKKIRLCLHAYQLNFTCPLTNKSINVTADYDQKLNNIIQSIKQQSES
jgi:23S rRNA pseudouridine955/2504/2580 synthase